MKPSRPLAHSYSALKQYENCPKQYYMQRISREIKPSYGEASIYGDRIHKQLEERIRDGVALPKESAAYEALAAAFAELPAEIAVEKEFTLNKELSQTGWWDADAWLRLKLDVLAIRGPEAVVADWKTGKRRVDWFQLELFSIVVMKVHQEVQQVKTSLVWLKDMKMDTHTYKREDAPALWNKLMGKVSLIENSVDKDHWPERPSGLCGWCPATKAQCRFK